MIMMMTTGAEVRGKKTGIPQEPAGINDVIIFCNIELFFLLNFVILYLRQDLGFTQ